MPPFEHLDEPLAHERGGGARGDGPPAQQDRAGLDPPTLGGEQAGGGLEGRGLARSVGAEQGHDAALGDLEGHASQRDDDVVVDDLHGVEREEGRRRRRS